jgi:hypothetical protein
MTASGNSLPMTRSRRSLAAIFRWPLLIGIASAYGLVSALVADGFWDWAASIGLAVPIVLAVWFYYRPAQS